MSKKHIQTLLNIECSLIRDALHNFKTQSVHLYLKWNMLFMYSITWRNLIEFHSRTPSINNGNIYIWSATHHVHVIRIARNKSFRYLSHFEITFSFLQLKLLVARCRNGYCVEEIRVKLWNQFQLSKLRLFECSEWVEKFWLGKWNQKWNKFAEYILMIKFHLCALASLHRMHQLIDKFLGKAFNWKCLSFVWYNTVIIINVNPISVHHCAFCRS